MLALDHATSTLSAFGADWIAHRNWSGDPARPHLGALTIVAGERGFAVMTRDATPKVLSVWPEPEHAKRYVEHVHNFGRPPV